MTAEIEFKREMNRNYLIMKPESGRNEKYAVRMLIGNRIPGFLPFHEKQVDGELRYYYDVTSKQPLERILEYRNLTGTELERLLADLLSALRQLERFLLDESSMSLKPELIYVEPDSFKSCFCLIPGHYEDFSESFGGLAQYLLDHVNHRDGDAVVLAFSVFRESRKENMGIEDIEKCLGRKEAAADPARTAIHPELAADPDRSTSPESCRSAMDHTLPAKTEATVPASGMLSREEGKQKAETGRTRRSSVWLAAAFAVMAAAPAAVLLLGGPDGLFRYKWLLGAAELCLGGACLGFISGINRTDTGMKDAKTDVKKDTESGNGGEPWEVWFGEEEDPHEEENDETDREADDEELRTVLLTARPVERECRRLKAVTGSLEIPIGYFPFLIGKSKGIVDFYLNEPGVSRLHIKIEETEEGYSVTDLNSTNGTRVNGRALEANETCGLPVGSEIEIAGRKFLFQ